MNKYIDIIDIINQGLEKFSTYLNSTYQIKSLTKNLADNTLYWNTTQSSWEEGRFPNSDKAGVYFMFAYKQIDKNVLGLYIGKAPHNSFIGRRLYSHLYQPKKSERIYPVHDKQGEKFLVEGVASIAMNEIYFLAPALEEFLIYFLQDNGVYLINAVGKI